MRNPIRVIAGLLALGPAVVGLCGCNNAPQTATMAKPQATDVGMPNAPGTTTATGGPQLPAKPAPGSEDQQQAMDIESRNSSVGNGQANPGSGGNGLSQDLNQGRR